MVRQIEIDYEPNAKQALFHMSDAEELVYGGAKGGGKSCAIVMEALAYGIEHPGAKIYLFRETYDDLEANLISEMKTKWSKELYSYNESKHIATLFNGTKVMFRYVRDKKDAEGYQGRSMDFIGVDELTKFDREWIQILLSCLRSPLGFPPRFRGTCNPGGRGHAWVKEDYVTGTNYGADILIDPVTNNRKQFISATVYDNTILMKNDPNYVKRLENLPELERRAFLHGDWDIFQGMYFSNWRKDKHVVTPFEIPSHWRKWRSVDYGFKDHAAILWYAADEDGRVYIYREMFVNQTLASAMAQEIKRLTGKESIRYTVAGHDMWQRRGNDFTSGENIAETFMNEGILVEKADIARIIGWSRIREYLEDAADGIPYLQVFSTCHNLIQAIPLMIHDDKKVEDVADHPLDHMPDSLRYGLMSRPIKSKAIPDDPGVIAAHKAKMIKRKKQFKKRIV